MREDNGNILKISFIDMHNILEARLKVSYSGEFINQKISVIKFTGTRIIPFKLYCVCTD
jgi:hypothetical protein